MRMLLEVLNSEMFNMHGFLMFFIFCIIYFKREMLIVMLRLSFVDNCTKLLFVKLSVTCCRFSIGFVYVCCFSYKKGEVFLRYSVYTWTTVLNSVKSSMYSLPTFNCQLKHFKFFSQQAEYIQVYLTVNVLCKLCFYLFGYLLTYSCFIEWYD